MKCLSECNGKFAEQFEKQFFKDNFYGLGLFFDNKLKGFVIGDIINIDNAMKWGFAWNKGPFEMLDELGPNKVIEKCRNSDIKVPKMLEILETSSHKKFYSESEEFLNLNGEYEKIV